MASSGKKVVREIEEQKKKEEDDRRQAEEEFLRKHQEEKILGRDKGAHLSGHSRTTSMSSLAESDGEVEGRKRVREKEASPGTMKKKRMEGEESEEELEFGQDPLRNIDIGIESLVEWSKQQTIQKMVTRPQHKKLEQIIKRLREEVTCGREERAKLVAMVEGRSSLAEVVRKTVREELERKEVLPQAHGALSYASALGRTSVPKVPKVTGVKGPVQPAPKLVIVRHKEKEGEEVESTLKRLIKPAEIGLKVKRLVRIRKGVMLEAEGEEGVRSLIGHKGLSEAGMTVERPAKKKPVIMIYDVSADLGVEEIRQELFSKNFQESDISQDDFNSEFELRHKYKDVKSAGKKSHIVVECSVRVRNWLRERERVFIEWQSCRVKDYVDVARCYKCQRYGHVAKHCNSEKPRCSYCAGEHDFKDCPDRSKKDKVCCVNCKRDGRVEVKHEVGWRRCPAYEKAVKRQNEKIDYGL